MNNDSPYALVIPIADTDPRCKDLLTNLLTSISWGKYDCPVVCLFDNCSPEFVKHFEAEFPFITSLPYNGEKNLNFTKNSNRGLKYVYEQGRGAFLINMDTVLPHKTHLEKIINNGISSPKAVHVDGTVASKFYSLNKLAEPGCPCNKTLDLNKGKPSVKFAAFCMWISKYAFAKIGYLDDQTFYSSFEDDDYCIRACLANLPCEQFDVQVHHELKDRETQISTTNSYDMATLMDHLRRFMVKWEIPPQVTHGDFPKFILMNKKWDDKYKISNIQSDI